MRLNTPTPSAGRLHLASVGRVVAAARLGIVGAAQFHHLARRVLDRLAALDEIAVAQPHFRAGVSRKNFFGGSSMKSSCST
jgi:hypothetical protein